MKRLYHKILQKYYMRKVKRQIKELEKIKREKQSPESCPVEAEDNPSGRGNL